ncbi:MAG: fatty acid--CoA ligase, partial [Alphaproteobacteria bacterium]
MDDGVAAQKEQAEVTQDITLAEEIRRQARARGDACALLCEGRATSYGAFDVHASQVAQGLIGAGVAPGDRVAYLGKNSDYYFELLIGAAKAGAVAVPVNWRLAAPEIAYILGDAAPKLLVVEPAFAPQAGAGAPAVRVIDSTAFAAWRDAQNDADPRRDAAYDQPVLQLYTSGTTGHPKGAVLSHRSLLSLRHRFPASRQPAWNRWQASDVSLIGMPVFHISGTGWGIWSLQHGAKGIVVREFDPHAVLDLLVEHRISKIMMVPTAMRIVLEHPRARETDFGFLENIYYGGAPIAPDLLRQGMEVFGCGFVQMYGMTETAGTVVGLPPADHRPDSPRLASVGVPLPGV